MYYMKKSSNLLTVLPRRGITIISGYRKNGIDSYVALYELNTDDSVSVTFPKGHSFSPGQPVTLHLDNRTGVSEYDVDLRVYRLSYKGTVFQGDDKVLTVHPDEYMVYYSNGCVLEYRAPGFTYDTLKREQELPESPITMDDLVWDEKEYGNKLGVLVTKLPSRPHSSLMAFLSNTQDDIFLITFRSKLKSRALHADNRCCFAIDHRAEFVFDKAYEWNYTVLEAEAYGISRDNPVFKEIQFHFVQKNPWESTFFLSPEIEMYHLRPQHILLPDTM